MKIFSKLFHKTSAKPPKAGKFDPADGQTVVSIAIAVLTLLAALSGCEFGLPGGDQEPRQLADETKPDGSGDEPFDPGSVSDL
ncbi:MAG: hypothetical protein K5650_04820 [Bacteroidales bacterium]|nr:hypothetical protein [Bacteroidales bacterium]